jgi:DNA-binding NtrC family response regulator
MERTDGNRLAASKLLGIHRNTLQRKITEYKLEDERTRKKPVHQARPVRRRVKAG